MAWSRDRSSTPAARGVLVQVVAVQAVLETAGRRAYCWRKAGGKARVLSWSGLSFRMGWWTEKPTLGGVASRPRS